MKTTASMLLSGFILIACLTLPAFAQQANGVKFDVFAGVCDSHFPHLLADSTYIDIPNADLASQAFEKAFPSEENGTSLSVKVTSYQVYPGHVLYRFNVQLIRDGKKDAYLNLSIPQTLSSDPDPIPYQAGSGADCDDPKNDGKTYILLNAGPLK